MTQDCFQTLRRQGEGLVRERHSSRKKLSYAPGRRARGYLAPSAPHEREVGTLGAAFALIGLDADSARRLVMAAKPDEAARRG